MADLVTTPLELTSTRFAHPAGETVSLTGARDDRVEMTMLDTGQPYPVPHRSTEFTGWRHHPIHGEVADGNAYHAFGGVSGHAGLFSTVPDLLRWATALADYEEYDALWRPEVVREFFTAGPDESQALGFRRYRLDLPGETVTVLGHPGYVGCAAGFVPGRGIALALGSNRLLVDRTPVGTETLFTELLTTTSGLLRGRRPMTSHPIHEVAMNSDVPLLAIRDLTVAFRTRDREVTAVRGVSLEIRAGQTVAVVGESGSGKSTTAAAINRLLPGNGRIVSGGSTVRGPRSRPGRRTRTDRDPRRGHRAGPAGPDVQPQPTDADRQADRRGTRRPRGRSTRRTGRGDRVARPGRHPRPRSGGPASTRTSSPAGCASAH